jgi:hypothetical protein
MTQPADTPRGQAARPGPARGAPAVGRGELAFWYGAAAVTYVGASIVEKALLNWFVGPLWLVAFVWLGPLAAGLLRGRGRAPVGGSRPR